MTSNNPQPVDGAGMAGVDRSADPGALACYLDAFSEQSLEMKIDSYTMLGINGGDRVLDVGCGTGDDVLRMAGIVGIDLSETMIDQARARARESGLPVEFLQGSAYDLPFPDDSFDACRCERVLQHLDEPLEAIREMARVVRPGGRVLLIDTDSGAEMVDTSYPKIHERIQASQQVRRRTEPGDGWRGRQLRGLAHEAGLVDVVAEGLVPVLTTLVAATAIAHIDTWGDRAAEQSVISRHEADTYLADLKDRDATGRFFAAAPVFLVAGTVPAANDPEGEDVDRKKA
ncbi:hypothetical protein BH23CHL2_BH23CHL2_19020 [soil metagenome]